MVLNEQKNPGCFCCGLGSKSTRRSSLPDGRNGHATQTPQPFHRQSHACHEKNVQ